MASNVAGFLFDDGTFFNCVVENNDIRLAKSQHGNFHLPSLAQRKASELSLQLSSLQLAAFREGGFRDSEGEIMLNVLHKISSDEPQQQSEEVPLLSQATAAEEETQNSRAWRFEWTHAAILLLIAEHGNKHELFSNSAMKKAEVWGMIARVLQEHGYKVTGEACDKKWRNLKDRYKAIRKTHSQTGSGRITWDFYDLMDNQLFDDPGCMPKKTVGSMCGVTINTTRPRANSDPAPVPASPCPSTSTSSEETMTRSPSTSQSTPKRTTKRKREDEEPPRWYLEHLQKQNTALEVIAKAMEKRNEVLQNIVDAMKK